jgi:hypothetical protein
VKAHPDPKTGPVVSQVSSQPSLGGHGGLDGSGRAGKHHEERVPFRTHLDPVAPSDGPADDGGMLVAEAGVPIAELLEQPGGPLDVGEQEGDRSGRELCHLRPAM